MMHGTTNIKFKICNTDCFSTTTMVTRTRLSVTLYILYLSRSTLSHKGHDFKGEKIYVYREQNFGWYCKRFDWFVTVQTGNSRCQMTVDIGCIEGLAGCLHLTLMTSNMPWSMDWYKGKVPSSNTRLQCSQQNIMHVFVTTLNFALLNLIFVWPCIVDIIDINTI